MNIRALTACLLLASSVIFSATLQAQVALNEDYPETYTVKKGDTVSALDIVAEPFMPGDVTPINIANMLALPPGDVPECRL